MVQKLWHKMQMKWQTSGPYCRYQVSTLFFLLFACLLHLNETIGYFQNFQLIFFLVTLFINLWRNFTIFQSTQYPVNFTLLASWKIKKPRSLQDKFYLEFQMSFFKPWRRMKQAVVKNVIAFRFVLNLLADFCLFRNIELHFTG